MIDERIIPSGYQGSKSASSGAPAIKDQPSALGSVLWTILGGETADLRLAARRLRLTYNTLVDIVHGRRAVSRRLIAAGKWRDVLSEHYHPGWSDFGTAFNRLAIDLGRRGKRSAPIAEPANHLSFGHVLWRILGGFDADFVKAAWRLDIPVVRLKTVLSGESRISLGLISRNHWRDVLAAHYPAGWAALADMFERRAKVDAQKVWNRSRKSQPDREGSFGHLLWQILGGEAFSVKRSAVLLEIPSKRLTGIIKGDDRATKAEVVGKAWSDRLAAQYPETWEIHAAAFQKSVEGLQAERRDPPAEPDTFAYVLWKILSCDDRRMSEAAKRLGLSPSYLCGILHDHRQPMQTTINAKKWREVFARHYADGWATYRDLFEERVSHLRPRKGPVIKPSNEGTFGHVLWEILGGRTIDMYEAPVRLSVKTTILGLIIQGKYTPTQAMIKKKRWRAALAEFYGAKWLRHAVTFDAHVAQLPRYRVTRLLEPEDKQSFGHVLWLIFGKGDVRLTRAGKQLRIAPTRLSGIIRGRYSIGARSVRRKGWRRVFAREYPVSWKRFSATFERRLAEMENRSPRARKRSGGRSRP